MNLGISIFVLFANLYRSKWEHNIKFLFHLWMPLLRRETKDTLLQAKPFGERYCFTGTIFFLVSIHFIGERL